MERGTPRREGAWAAQRVVGSHRGRGGKVLGEGECVKSKKKWRLAPPLALFEERGLAGTRPVSRGARALLAPLETGHGRDKRFGKKYLKERGLGRCKRKVCITLGE